MGSSALAYLAASGIGKIGIADHDRVELSNLQRQILFETADIGRSKAKASADRISEMNPDCELELFEERVTEQNASKIAEKFDIVLDGSDNFATRFAVADACAAKKIPLVSAAVIGFSGQISVFKPYLDETQPCYHCLVPETPKRERNCAMEGIISPLAGIMGSFQALETIKELLGIGESLTGKLIIMDALTSDIRKVSFSRDGDCLHHRKEASV